MLKNIKKYAILSLFIVFFTQSACAGIKSITHNLITAISNKMYAIRNILCKREITILRNLPNEEKLLQKIVLRAVTNLRCVKCLSLPELEEINKTMKSSQEFDGNIDELIAHIKNEKSEITIYGSKHFSYNGVICFIDLVTLRLANPNKAKVNVPSKKDQPKKGCLKKEGAPKGLKKNVRFNVPAKTNS